MISAYLLQRIEGSGGEVKVEKLSITRLFCLAANAPDGSEAVFIFERSAIMYVDIHVRHGTALQVRKIRWLISKKRVPEPLLRRTVLEFLGLNTSEILATAADRSADIVDAKNLSQIDERTGEGRIYRLLEGAFHAEVDGETEYDGLPYSTSYGSCCNLGTESEQDW